MVKPKIPKFSYSKLNTYDSCGWKYKLTYEDGHYTYSDSLASYLGATVHHIEEKIADTLKAGQKPDYEALKEEFKTINIPKKNPFDTEGGLFGIEILKSRYKEEFYATSDTGVSYYTSTLDYLAYGIYRLEQYMTENPDLEIFDTEKYFSVDFEGHILSGYIDRIFHNKATDEYLIEDIKTRSKVFKDSELALPLQLVIYTYALSQALDIPVDKIHCAYDLPFCDQKQPITNPKLMKNGLAKLSEIFAGIGAREFAPSPSPLCHWCSFCPTNEEQPEAGKYLCPYYSLWTKENKTFAVSHKWEGMEKHQEILKDEIEKLKRIEEEKKTQPVDQMFDFEF